MRVIQYNGYVGLSMYDIKEIIGFTDIIRELSSKTEVCQLTPYFVVFEESESVTFEIVADLVEDVRHYDTERRGFLFSNTMDLVISSKKVLGKKMVQFVIRKCLTQLNHVSLRQDILIANEILNPGNDLTEKELSYLIEALERRKTEMALAGSMTTGIYDSEIRTIHHDLGHWIINHTYWYSDKKYTEKEAKEKFLNRDLDCVLK